VTCYRVGLRLDEPRMPALLVSHGRPGFYCRVLVEGEVEAGQEIVKIASGPEQMTVADINALLYLPGHPRDQLDRALRIPALSAGWVGSLKGLRDRADRGSQAPGNPGLTEAASGPPPAWPGFRPLKVVDVHQQSQTVFSLSLGATDGSPLPKWLAGQYITVRLPPPRQGAPVIRSYSLCNRPGSEQYRIGVKQEIHGVASAYIRQHVAVGDTIDVAAPRGSFFLADGDEPVILLSAGVGVTPVLAMLHSLASTAPTRPVWWIHGARNNSEHPFAAESRDLLTTLPQSHTHVSFSRPTTSDHEGVDYTARGRLSTDVLTTLNVPRDARAYLCGPTSFMTEFRAALIGYGLTPARVHVETFGAGPAITPGITEPTRPPHPPQSEPGPGPTVAFARSALAAPWHPSYPSLLDFAEACDVPTRWACRTGVCHSCETALFSGTVDYDPEPLEPPAAGNVLICSARPREDVVLDL
jgi:ferredoxin-NADP reductase